MAARWNDTDIVHVLGQSLIIQGTPGGPVLEEKLPSSQLITLTQVAGGNLAAGKYNYKLVWVDSNGNESLASVPTRTLTVPAASQIRLQQLPPAPTGFVARRLYRSDGDGMPTSEYRLVAQLNASATTFTDVGNPGGNLLDQSGAAANLRRARLNASLVIDPNTIVKSEGARIEVGMGAQLLAEGRDGQRVIFTSKLDDKFGAGGTFDTGNDGTVNVADPRQLGWHFRRPDGDCQLRLLPVHVRRRQWSRWRARSPASTCWKFTRRTSAWRTAFSSAMRMVWEGRPPRTVSDADSMKRPRSSFVARSR